MGACWEKLPKIVKITLLQFNYEFGHGNFFTVWSSQHFQNIYRRKRKLSTETLIIKSQSCDKFPVFMMFACFHSNETIQPFIIPIFRRPKVAFHKLLILWLHMVDHLTIKFNSIKFNSLGLLFTQNMIKCTMWYLCAWNLHKVCSHLESSIFIAAVSLEIAGVVHGKHWHWCE